MLTVGVGEVEVLGAEGEMASGGETEVLSGGKTEVLSGGETEVGREGGGSDRDFPLFGGGDPPELTLVPAVVRLSS